jgi:hypothetical protein
VYYGRPSAKGGSSKTLARCDETPVYLIFVETGDILTAFTLPIRVLQHATDPFMRNHFPGRQCVYYGRPSAKGGSSKTLARCDETPVYLIFVETGDILTAFTLPIRVLQQATDPCMPDYFLGGQWVYFGRPSAKGGSSKTIPCCNESPVSSDFCENRRHSYHYDPDYSISAASDRPLHAQPLSGQAVRVLRKRLR